ncbi:PadR family transcriptional regulator [Oleiagrimonas sp. C23AA]|nr:PadR family transcriptional regulator [Oleiagrimonas sp. C23AA]
MHERMHEMREAMRHGRRGGFGRFGGMDNDFEGQGGRRGGGRFGGGRIFGHGDLKLVLLSLIAQKPRHGYELIRIIEDMFEGRYAPSPGAVYPTLTLLEEMGQASVEAGEGGRKCYAITDAGRDFLEENREAVEAVMSRLEMAARHMKREATPQALRRAMHDLKHAVILHGARGSSEEAERICAILERATQEILGDRD